MFDEPADLLRTRPDQLPLWHLVEARAAMRPHDLLAVDSDGRRMTFGEYHTACLAAAAALQLRGVHRETRVAWMLPTRLEALVLAGALARLGAVQIPLIPILRDREVGEGGVGRSLGSRTDETGGAGEEEGKVLHGRVDQSVLRWTSCHVGLARGGGWPDCHR